PDQHEESEAITLHQATRSLGGAKTRCRVLKNGGHALEKARCHLDIDPVQRAFSFPFQHQVVLPVSPLAQTGGNWQSLSVRGDWAVLGSELAGEPFLEPSEKTHRPPPRMGAAVGASLARCFFISGHASLI